MTRRVVAGLTVPDMAENKLHQAWMSVLGVFTSAEHKLMETLTFALNPGGILFLGTSESVDGFANDFVVLDSKRKLFQRRPYLQVPIARETATFPPRPRATVGTVAPVVRQVPVSTAPTGLLWGGLGALGGAGVMGAALAMVRRK